jgi:CheY-like chemotaxis protein
VVEDEALTAMALQQLLEDAGYIVLGPVGRVEDALDLLRSGPLDAAILYPLSFTHMSPPGRR